MTLAIPHMASTFGSRASPPLPNSYWVLKGRLLAGEYPGGYFSLAARHNLNLLLDAGMDAFIDLTAVEEKSSYDRFLPDGVTYRRLPIANRGVPKRPEEMAAIIAALDEALAQGRNVYLHCKGGVGRTGMVLACWLQHHGKTPKAALRHLSRLYRHAARSKHLRQIPENACQIAWVMEWPALSASLAQEPPRASAQAWAAPSRRPARLWPWSTA